MRRVCPTCAHTGCTRSPPAGGAGSGARSAPACAARERVAAARALVAPLVLERARAACDGPMLLMKGPELAARYPDQVRRPFAISTSLVQSPARHTAQRCWPPVSHPSVPRRRPRTTAVYPPPAARTARDTPPCLIDSPPTAGRSGRVVTGARLGELLAVAVPSATGVDGVLGLRLARGRGRRHSWSEAPLRRCSRPRRSSRALAGRGRAAGRRGGRGATRPRRRRGAAMVAAGDAVLGFAPPTRPAEAVGARRTAAAPTATVIENHLARVLSPFSVLPAGPPRCGCRRVSWAYASSRRRRTAGGRRPRAPGGHSATRSDRLRSITRARDTG